MVYKQSSWSYQSLPYFGNMGDPQKIAVRRASLLFRRARRGSEGTGGGRQGTRSRYDSDSKHDSSERDMSVERLMEVVYKK